MPSKSASMMAAISGETTCHRPSVGSVVSGGCSSSVGEAEFGPVCSVGVSSCLGVGVWVLGELHPAVKSIRMHRVLMSV